MMKKMIYSFIFILLITFTGCSKIEKEEYRDVTAIVTKMKKTNMYTTQIPVKSGNSTVYITQVHPESFLVTLKYEDIEDTFDDEELYGKVEIGDSLLVTLYEGYSEDGKIVKQKLHLKD